MQVETYEVESVGARPEVDDEALQIAERLGLEGQLKLAERTETKTPVPYRRMTDRELRVYGVICPSHVSVEKYSTGTIPLRVLQVLEHARSLGFFESFQVWHPTDAAVRDPILVGITKEPGEAMWLLARWGEVLDSFATLCGEAGRMWRLQTIAALVKCEQQAKQERSALEEMSDVQALGVKRNPYNWQSEPTFYGVLG